MRFLYPFASLCPNYVPNFISTCYFLLFMLKVIINLYFLFKILLLIKVCNTDVLCTLEQSIRHEQPVSLGLSVLRKIIGSILLVYSWCNYKQKIEVKLDTMTMTFLCARGLFVYRKKLLQFTINVEFIKLKNIFCSIPQPPRSPNPSIPAVSLLSVYESVSTLLVSSFCSLDSSYK